ncbi:MAG: M3 family metallopeptidase [Alphaproteobacteria bacterium]|nr:M3 family metallopeptidase [Alphaproteobacteria bacterium]
MKDTYNPEWNLTTIFSTPDTLLKEEFWSGLSQKMGHVLKRLDEISTNSSHNDFKAFLDELDAVLSVNAQVRAYAYLRFSQDMAKEGVGEFFQNVNERNTALDAQSAQVFTRLACLPTDYLESVLKNPLLADYEEMLQQMIDAKPHTLSPSEEAQWVERDVTAGGAWKRLAQETLGSTRVQIDDQTLSLSETSNLMRDRDEAIREKSLKGMMKALSANVPVMTTAWNAVMKDHAISNQWRKYKSPDAAMHMHNRVDDAWVNALHESVIASFPSTSHELFRLRAQCLGKATLEVHDLQAPMVENLETISFFQSMEWVKGAYAGFYDPAVDYIERMLKEGRLDAALRPSKEGGAFCYTIPKKGPFVLTNHHGSFRDALCLFHELGHALHGFYASNLPAVSSHSSIILAEVASLFSEKLCLEHMMQVSDNKEQKKYYFASYMSDQLRCIQGSITYSRFEKRMHTMREKTEVSSAVLQESWREFHQDCFGASTHLPEQYGLMWSAVPHFFHTPFYVYSYAFSGLIVHAIWKKRKEQGFVERYIEFLSKGGTISFEGMRAMFDLPNDPQEFFAQALESLQEEMTQLKKYLGDKS